MWLRRGACFEDALRHFDGLLIIPFPFAAADLFQRPRLLGEGFGLVTRFLYDLR